MRSLSQTGDCHTSHLNDSEQEETHHMVTRGPKKIPYCYPGTSSGKRKKVRSTSQPHFRSRNSPATTEADQVLLALQHLAMKILNLPKSLTTTMPNFDGKTEKFELFQDLLRTCLKIHNPFTEQDKLNHFHSLKRGNALQTFENITSLNRRKLGEILTVFSRKYLKPQSMATA